ncbi:hypothetical protein BT93_C0994 [Corymbia citriodora subsp. variegata]|nr:hypothetical protein BT93_C0994 [Corymbia citriodora subsp. variegata]
MIARCFCLVFLSIHWASHIASSVVYNITTSEQLFPNQTLVSSGQIFELGFFTPNGSENQYVGLWYKKLQPSKILWVANRDVPLMYTDRSAKLMIGSDGNLKLMDGQQNVVWSTNVSGRSNYNSAVLLDSGNFVLQDANCGVIWGSFEDPTDTLLPSMKMGLNVRTGAKQFLISWRSYSDPSPGSFSTGMTSEMPPQPFTWNGSTPYWRGGQWDKSKFIGIGDMDGSYLSGFNVQQDIQQGITYFWFDTYNSFFGYVFISPGGSLKTMKWDDGAKAWLTNWLAQKNTCEIYGTCGPFGVCNSLNSRICRCLYGFVPKSNVEWTSGNWTGGCVRETELNCQKNTSTSSSTNVKKDAFWLMSQMKLPDSGEYLSDVGDREGCLSWCLSNCSCVAYSYVKTIGCMVWTKDLIDLQEFSNVGEDLFVRVARMKTDSIKKAELDWGKRFQIIQGIARGLLYLHRDSCLRVIHRDLKVSNILLDEKMNPKISDFGLARMFQGTQVLVNTHKIVGTLGYMSPEYAMGGMFSERSDIYSFGVLLLEIVSGKKNTDLCDQGQYLNLLSYAWQLWSECHALDLMDETIAVSPPLEVIRCIHVGLLCVQDHAMERPNMSAVVLMLSGESDLHQPRQPTFTFQTKMPNRAIPSQQEGIWSVNTVTNTTVKGR